MANKTNLANVIAGGNLMLWVEFLGAPVIWLCEFQLLYGLLPWSCAHGHLVWLRVVWWLFLLLSIALGFLAALHWLRLRALEPEDPRRGRARFMAALGVMMSVIFSLTILVQGIATYIFHPCLK